MRFDPVHGPVNFSVSPQIAAQLHKHLPVAATLLLTVMIGLQVSKLVWLLIPLPEPAPASAPAAPQPGNSTRARAQNINQLTSARLFGQFQREEASAATVADAPDTNLRLKLRGILATDDAKRSRALIEAANGELLSYAVGSDVPGGAKLHSIHPDRVLLSRGGRLETLRLEKDAPIPDGSVVTTAAASSARGAGSAAQILGTDTAAKLTDIRNTLLEDPTKASNFLRLQPARVNGQMKGYRIYPGRDRDLFREAGLRPGDIVTAVNGISLDDPARGLQLLGDLSTASQINLQIERGGQAQSLSVTLN